VNRRKLLGFIAGGAVAGPAAAKSIVAELPKGLSGGMMPFPGGGVYAGYGNLVGPTDPGSGDWRLREIADIKRWLSGELTDEEKEREQRRRMHTLQNSITQNVAGLRSVSGLHKMRMFDGQMHALNDRIERSERKGYLSRLLRETHN